MKSLLERNKEFIIFLNQLLRRERYNILTSLGGKYINTIAEIFSNFLKQNLTTNPSIIKKVKSCRSEIRAISSKNVPLYKKKKDATE